MGRLGRGFMPGQIEHGFHRMHGAGRQSHKGRQDDQKPCAHGLNILRDVIWLHCGLYDLSGPGGPHMVRALCRTLEGQRRGPVAQR